MSTEDVRGAGVLERHSAALLPHAEGCGGGLLAQDACPVWVALDDHGREDKGRAVALSPDGAVAYTAGYRTGNGGFWDREATVVARDVATGALLWTFALPSATGPNELRAIAADAERVVAVGPTHDGVGHVFRLDQLTLSFDPPTGEAQWTSVLDLGTWTSAHAVLLAQGSVFVAGSDELPTNHSRAFVRALDAGPGEARWLRTFGAFRYNDLATWPTTARPSSPRARSTAGARASRTCTSPRSTPRPARPAGRRACTGRRATTTRARRSPRAGASSSSSGRPKARSTSGATRRRSPTTPRGARTRPSAGSTTRRTTSLSAASSRPGTAGGVK